MASTHARTGRNGEPAGELGDELRDAASAELALLREKVELLMRERVTPAIAGVAGRAEDAAQHAADAVRRQAEGVATAVRDQPIAALGAATLAGVAIGLLLRR